MKIAFAAAAALLATTPVAAHEHDDRAPEARGQSAFGYDEFYEDTGFGGRGIFAYQGDGVYESPYDRDARSAERLERDRDGRLTYDRSYPYRFRSRARVSSSVVVTADRMDEFDGGYDGGYDGRDDAATVRVHRDGRLSR